MLNFCWQSPFVANNIIANKNISEKSHLLADKSEGITYEKCRVFEDIFLGRKWINNQRKLSYYNPLHWRAYLLCPEIITNIHLNNHICQHCGMKTSSMTPFFIAFLMSPCPVTTAYQVSSEIYGGFFYYGITLNLSFLQAWDSCKTRPDLGSGTPDLTPGKSCCAMF